MAAPSPYHVSIVIPPRLHCYFGSVGSFGVWTKGPRAVYGPIGVWERMIVWRLSVQCLVHWLGLLQEKCADLALQGTLAVVYTHTTNAKY